MADPSTQEQTLYPCKDSLEEAREYINSQLPIISPNDMHAALMIYHNTLLHVKFKERLHGYAEGDS